MPETMIERVARRLCAAHLDSQHSTPEVDANWQSWTDGAVALLHELFSPIGRDQIDRRIRDCRNPAMTAEFLKDGGHSIWIDSPLTITGVPRAVYVDGIAYLPSADEPAIDMTVSEVHDA